MATETVDSTSVERDILVKAQSQGPFATLLAYLRLSGPGWLQSAITLGGGSLAGSLYLGVLAGFSLLWLQPLFMILGIIMLSAIGYVTMSTSERPFWAICRHINPVLAWAWAIASLMANIVWCLPQFSLANGVLEQNLLPGLFSEETGVGVFWGKVIVSAVILVVTILITWSYGSGHWGIKLYEWMLKLMVASIVVCFFIVVYSLTASGQLDWGAIALGFVPDPTRIFRPAPGFEQPLSQIAADHRDYWRTYIVDSQQSKMAAAAATAVGINMTFLFPYSILRKGWTKEFRGLQIFDLGTGMFIPFVLATSCVVIASAAKFHAQPVPGLVPEVSSQTGDTRTPTGKEESEFIKIMSGRLQAEIGKEAYQELSSGDSEFAAVGAAIPERVARMSEADQESMKKMLGAAAVKEQIEQLPVADRTLGAMLVDRDANRLSQALAPLETGDAKASGSKSANYLFGVGVVGMTLSTITLLMLISGFVICEVFKLNPSGWTFRLACLPAAIGVLGPFVWSKAAFALAVPTSVFGLILLPIAYITFVLMFNSRSLMGKAMPTGGKRLVWNVLMIVAAGVATASSLYMVWSQTKWNGMIAIGALLGLALIVQVYRWVRPPKDFEETTAKAS
ncbi:MAG: divalent metal cation transporter [Pirellulaceae bacterium]